MISMASEFHTPVLGPDVSKWLVTDPEGVYVDATVGGGGHAEYLLEQTGERGRLVGLDRDPDAICESARRLARFGERVTLVRAPFWEMPRVLDEMGVFGVAGIIFDLGVSSHQIDDADRGFSYRQDGPLDMRMGADAPQCAQDVVNGYSQQALTRVFRVYGEERAAARIARAICRRRERRPVMRTLELAELVAQEARGPHTQKTLARIFQAIRIEVNGELDRLSEAIDGAVDALRPGGRVGVLSYHSLEDRTVKQVFRDAARGCICPRDLPVCGCGHSATLKVLTPKGIRPRQVEQARNPRCRSATLRVAARLSESTG